MLKLVKYVRELAEYYSVRFVNITTESGLDNKNISIWSYDTVHFNGAGNEIFGNFLANQIANI